MSNQPATTVAPGTGSDGAAADRPQLHHVGIMVTDADFEPMIEWYCKVLDLEINYKGRWEDTQMCFLVNDEANHRVVFITNPALQSEPQGPYARLGHTAYEFATIDGLLAKYAQLRDEGILPYMTIDHGLTMSIYYLDPNGYGIELQVDALGDWAKSKQWMATSPVFRENPVGILFDPEQVIEARENGMSLAGIHAAAYDDGAFPPTPEQRQRLAVMGVPLKNMWDHPSWGDDHPTFAGLAV